jgi:hypothetical protein
MIRINIRKELKSKFVSTFSCCSTLEKEPGGTHAPSKVIITVIIPRMKRVGLRTNRKNEKCTHNFSRKLEEKYTTWQNRCK